MFQKRKQDNIAIAVWIMNEKSRNSLLAPHNETKPLKILNMPIHLFYICSGLCGLICCLSFLHFLEFLF